MLRGLLGSSARQVIGKPDAFTAYADPRLDDPITRTIGAGAKMMRPDAITPDVDGERQARADKWSVMGAALADAGAALQGMQGGGLSRVQDEFRRRHKAEREAAQESRIMDLASELYGDDEEARLLFQLSPEKFVSERMKAREPEKPVLVNTRLGPRAFYPSTGKYETLEDIPERLPAGYRYNEQGEVELDPAFLAGQGALSEARARATAKYRAPKSGGGGGGSRPASGGGAKPWERTW